MQQRPHISPGSDAGMTLVEILVALAIIAVMTGIAVMSVGASDRSAGPEIEARRMAARIDLAADLALIEGNPVNLKWDAQGYSFTLLQANGAARIPAFGARHELGSGLQLSGPSQAGSIIIAEDAGARVASFVVQGVRQGSGADWSVNFNGLSAIASRVAAS